MSCSCCVLQESSRVDVKSEYSRQPREKEVETEEVSRVLLAPVFHVHRQIRVMIDRGPRRQMDRWTTRVLGALTLCYDITKVSLCLSQGMPIVFSARIPCDMIWCHFMSRVWSLMSAASLSMVGQVAEMSVRSLSPVWSLLLLMNVLAETICVIIGVHWYLSPMW